MFTSKDTARCPYCKRTLSLFDDVLGLYQCDYDRTVYSQESFIEVQNVTTQAASGDIASYSDFHELQKLIVSHAPSPDD